jgi:transposase
MDYVTGTDRGEALLFPEAFDDYLTPENPVRFIDAFVEQLDLAKLGFKHAQLNETGRPPYHPGDLLRLYLYGYLNRLRSSRQLEPELQEAMAERVRQNPQIMRRRKAIIEHVFGTIKRSLGYDYFLCRGFHKVATEIHLTVLAYNLKRVCNLVGVPALIKAVS